jgi:hypothetical protein
MKIAVRGTANQYTGSVCGRLALASYTVELYLVFVAPFFFGPFSAMDSQTGKWNKRVAFGVRRARHPVLAMSCDGRCRHRHARHNYALIIATCRVF